MASCHKGKAKEHPVPHHKDNPWRYCQKRPNSSIADLSAQRTTNARELAFARIVASYALKYSCSPLAGESAAAVAHLSSHQTKAFGIACPTQKAAQIVLSKMVPPLPHPFYA
jgi:hypothetical protein